MNLLLFPLKEQIQKDPINQNHIEETLLLTLPIAFFNTFGHEAYDIVGFGQIL